MNLNRRHFLATSTAAVAALMVGMPTAAAAVEPAVVAPVVPRAGWWGYSTNDGEWWHGPFDSREQALAQAIGDAEPGDTVQTGWAIPRATTWGDLREDIVEWLSEHAEGSLADKLQRSFEGANEENDYEGDLSAAIEGADYKAFERACLAATCAALHRIDRVDVAVLVQLPGDDVVPLGLNDEALDLISEDKTLGDELEAAAVAFVADQDLDEVGPRCLDLESEEHHEVPSLV